MKQTATGKNVPMDRWGKYLSLLIGLVLIVPLWSAFDSRSIAVMVILAWVLSLACVVVHTMTRRYFLEGVLAGMGGGLSFQLWTTTGRYAFVQNADSLHFWRISLSVALFVIMVLMLADYLFARRRHLARPGMASSMLTLVCVAIVVFGQCEASLTHLNVAWDNSTPRHHLCEVEGNWVEKVYRSVDQTVLLLRKEGETVRLVRAASYAEFYEGEEVILLEYEGAFHQAYYVLEEKE